MIHPTPIQPAVILVVDDFDDFRALMKAWLTGKGYRVIEAADGDWALKEALRERPDLIIMDIGMPNRGGISATYRILKQPELRATPIVAVTAYASPDLHADALKAGCRDCLTKPISDDQLKDLLDRYLPNKTMAEG